MSNRPGPSGPHEGTVAPKVNLQACQSAPPITPAMKLTGPLNTSAPVQIGQAIDPIAGNLYPGVVCVELDRSVAQEVGRDFSMTVSLARDANELAAALGVNTAAGFNIGLWRAHPASDFLRNLKMEHKTLYAVLRARVQIREQGGPAAVQLKGFARQLLSEGGYSKFIRRCGTAFISHIHQGGEMAIVVEFPSTTAAERDAIQQALSGGPTEGVDEQRIQSLEALVDAHVNRITVLRPGGAGNAASLSFPSLIKLARELPAAVQRSARPVAFEASAYQTVESFPAQVLDRYNSADSVLTELGRLYNTARGEWSSIGSFMRLLSSSGEGWGTYDKDAEESCRALAGTFKQTRDVYTEYINGLERAARVCINERPESTCFHNDLCSVPVMEIPPMPEVPASCRRSCAYELNDLVGAAGVAADKKDVQITCDGLIPGETYKVSVERGRIGVTKGCIDSSGRDLPISLYGGFGKGQTFAGRAGESSLTFDPKAIKASVPSSGKLSVPLTLENQNGEKGCVYNLSGKVEIVPAK